MTDDDLHRYLHNADPAASLAPISNDQVTQLLNEAMSRPVIEPSHLAAEPTAKRTWGKPWLIAASVLIATGAAGALGSLPKNPDGHGTAPVVARVSVPGGQVSKCTAPRAEELRSADLAVEGIVHGTKNGNVVLHVSRVWAGPRTDLVEIAPADGVAEQVPDEVAFTNGQEYLVAIFDGKIHGCGYSGLATPELEALYRAAF